MRRYILINIFFALAFSPVVFAQEEVVRFPQKGDWAISVNAMPALRYIGQLFNGTNSNTINQFGGQAYLNNDVTTLDFGNINPLVSILAKYFVSDNLAIRINAGWLYQNTTDNYYVQDDAELVNNPISTKKLIDTHNASNNGVSLMIGPESRVGERFIQGVFGGGLLYANQVANNIYYYGNVMNEDNRNPSTMVGGTAIPQGFVSARLLENKTLGSMHYLGLVGFVGVEWFFTSKMSIGGEVNVAAVHRWGGAAFRTVEGYNTLSSSVGKWSDLTAPTFSGFLLFL